MPIVSATNSSVVTFSGQELIDLIISAAVAAGATAPDMGEVEDQKKIRLNGPNLTNGYTITAFDPASVSLVVTLVDAEGEGTTPVV